jgi:PAS domain S-box-containing protein
MALKPKPIDVEVVLDPSKVIMSKTNKRGIILYVNDYFCEIAKYNRKELLGSPHNIIRHPDMPKVIFKLLWDKLKKGENLYAVVKNLTKDGSYYWVVTKFETTYDNKGNILAHYARRKAIPDKIKEISSVIYDKIRKIEEIDEQVAEDTFFEILKSYNLTYDDFFLEMTGLSNSEVEEYFLNKDKNVNAKTEDIVKGIDEEELEVLSNQKNDEFFILNNIESLKQQVSQLKEKIEIKDNKKEDGFFGDIAKELKKEISELKNKKN